MSKIGKISISIPEKVKVALTGNMINIEGPLGKKSVNIDLDPENAIKNADLIMTDTWSSMHDQKESNYEARQRQLMPFQVNEKLISKSKDDAIFMHCLPAYRGQEVTSDVIDGMKSVVFDQAENRLHVQKSILEWCISGKL